jgi:GDP-L-fucose synthase
MFIPAREDKELTSPRIALTGDTGFLGQNLKDAFREGEVTFFAANGQANYDFTRYEDCEDFIRTSQPKVLIHLAALSGGIGANRERPDEFFHVNMLLVTNMFRAAALNGVEEMVYTFGGCSYPNTATSPIKEQNLWDGIPHGDSSAYSMAKKMGVIAANAYKKYGLKSKLLIPGNLYGKFDNYSLENSHVIPAMIRKFYEAKNKNAKSVSMWGDGSPTRDFVYAGDVAKAIVKALDMNLPEEPINLSTGTSISIKNLAETVAAHLNYSGELFWDTSKPNGQQDKIFSVTKAKSLGLVMETKLDDGLKQTIKWFEENYDIPCKVRL